jgi:hypothetical protein
MMNSKKKSLCGICVMRDEEDIIERFIRHNLQYLDVIFCIDNESQDRTLQILSDLKKEGLPIEISITKEVRHSQREFFDSAIHFLKTKFDIIFCLDADEFILAKTPEDFWNYTIKLMISEQPGLIPWILGVPTLNTQTLTLDCALDGEREYYKLITPSSLFNKNPDFKIGPGNHFLTSEENQEIEYFYTKDIFLLHIPFRAIDQFVGKMVCGELSLKLNSKRNVNEGWHWKYLYDSWKQAWQEKKEFSEQSILEVCAKLYLFTPLEECNLILLDDFQWEQEDCIYITNQSKSNDQGINIFDKILHKCLHIIESLEKTKYSSETSRLGQTAHGVICYDNRDSVIGTSIEIYGEWASEELLFLEKYINNRDTVVDVGANIGTHTLRFAQLVGKTGEVHAFEPQRIVFQKLCATIALNDLSNVFTHNYGLGSKESLVSVKNVTSGNIENFSIRNQQSELGEENIKVITLDSLNLRKCNFIKVDIEGMEEEMLKGARKTISSCRPILFVENNIIENSESLLTFIIDLEYDCWWHFSSYFNKDNFYKNTVNIFSEVKRPEINVICFPKELNIELDLKKIILATESWTNAYYL